MTRLARTGGMSLLEVMVAVALFSTVAAALGVATAGTIRANGTSRLAAAAAALVYDKFDQLRALDPATAPADLGAGAHVDPRNPLTALGAAGGIYTRTWTVTANTPRSGLAEVVVRVAWQDTAPRSIQGVAYVCTSATCS